MHKITKMGLLLPSVIFLLMSAVVPSKLAQGSLHFYDFVLKETNYTRLCSTNSIMTVNDSFPGPVIRVQKGDTVYVNVHNAGDYGVTLHWHGVKQPRNPWSDGPEYITQCPIEPGTNFTYEVQFTEEEGTLWWHAHSDWTRATVHGAIVILPASGTTYPFPEPDEEEVIVLGNWYKGNLRELVEEALETGLDTPRSDAYTINGQPGDLCPCSKETTYRKLVDPGKTYLLRMVNAANNADLFFTIAEHNLTAVGVDGAYIKPVNTSYIMISAGESMDVLVTANQSPSYYYMAARQYSSDRSGVTLYDHSNATAIFQYTGNYTPPVSPTFPSALPPYKDNVAAITFSNRFRSLANEEHPANVPLNVTTRMFVVASMGQVMICPNESCAENESKLASSLNNISWVNPSMDVLQAYYRNISGIYEADFPNQPPTYYNFTADDVPSIFSYAVGGTRVKELEYGETVEMVIQGTNTMDTREAHPVHLHGYSFYVVGSGPGNFNEQTDPKSYNLIDPPYMNTVPVPTDGWAAVRFVANNPGVWYIHCHFDRHLSWGMDTVFIVKDGNTTESSMRPPPAYMPPCKVSVASKANYHKSYFI